MQKLKVRTLLETTFLGIAALCLLAGVFALGFVENLSKENQARIIFSSSLGVLFCFIGLLAVQTFWRWLRKRIWRRSMTAWQAKSEQDLPPQFDMAHHLSAGGLRFLAIHTHARMGYHVINQDEDDEAEDYLRLRNPDGGLELLAYAQQTGPVEIRAVYALSLAVKQENALCGYFWAPGGFSAETIHWARHKPIVLAGQHEIGHLVDCVRANGSALLESR